MRVVVAIVSLVVVGGAGLKSDAGVAGRIVILEKDNKPSPDLSDAVLYLEAPATVATAGRPSTVEIAITDKTYAPHVVVVPAGRYRLHVWHERIPSEVVRDVTVGATLPDLQIALNARGYKWEPHRNKYGRNYPTNAGRERY